MFTCTVLVERLGAELKHLGTGCLIFLGYPNQSTDFKQDFMSTEWSTDSNYRVVNASAFIH